MLPYFVEHYANPSSSQHRYGRDAAAAVAIGREKLGGAIGAASQEIVFTSGATESNNLAILGFARADATERREVVVSAIEHKCVLAAAESLRTAGFRVLIAPVDAQGIVDLGWLIDHIGDSTALVSIQAANNEIGTIQAIAEIAQVIHRVGAAFHCDAAQALGRVPIDVRDWDVDLLSLSGHKAYGPKGIGALYIRGGARSAPLVPLLLGGGQESGLRSGTLNVPGIVGFGVAADLATSQLTQETDRIRRMRDRLEARLLVELPGTSVNGDRDKRLCGNSSLTFEGADAEAIIANAPELAVSTGSACSSGAIGPSYVLQAIGLSRELAFQTLRIGLGRFTMPDDIEGAVSVLTRAVRHVREAVFAGGGGTEPVQDG
jgi:cysteine desulfurase